MTKAFGSGNWRDEAYDDLLPNSKGTGGGRGWKPSPRCADTHPALKLPNSELVIYGGSCSHPKIGDADVYIGFDHSMHFTRRAWPWNPGEEFLFPITDMQAPANPEQFAKLVDWTIEQLQAGKKVHCGCIGGHGRTGTFLAAIVAKLGEPDAISYVRANYCQKAVESGAQVEFLHKHYGVKKVGGTKSYGGYSGAKSSPAMKTITSSGGQAKGGRSFAPLPKAVSIWGPQGKLSQL